VSTYEKHLTVPRIHRRPPGHRVACAALASVALGAGTGAAAAEAAPDLRPPDVREATPAVVTPPTFSDVRSPDVRDGRPVVASGGAQDLRSPDAKDAGTPGATVPAPVADTGGLDWELGVAGGGLLTVLVGLGGMTVAARRRSTAGRSAAA
jgi:hypothetical protein